MVTALKFFGIIVLLLMGIGVAMGLLALAATIGGFMVMAAIGGFVVLIAILAIMDFWDWLKRRFKKK